MKFIFIALFTLVLLTESSGQEKREYIYSSDGATLGLRKQFISNCRSGYGRDEVSKVILDACECQVSLIDGKFPIKKIRAYLKKYKGQAYVKLVSEDSLLNMANKSCLEQANKVSIFSNTSFKNNFINSCKRNLARNTKEERNDSLIQAFCDCAAGILSTRNVSLEEIDDITDPSSFLFNEVAYKCGSPYKKSIDLPPNWKQSDTMHITGSKMIDTIQTLSLYGQHKIKVTIGKDTRFWMLDSGASDLMITEEYLKKLKEAGSISEKDLVGEGKYVLADNRSVECKKYRLQALRIGNFTVNNLIVGVFKDGGEFLLGKVLLNKFSQWTLDNKNNWLILKK